MAAFRQNRESRPFIPWVRYECNLFKPMSEETSSALVLPAPLSDSDSVILHEPDGDHELAWRVATLESITDALVITDRKGDIQWTNSAFSRLTGYSSEETRGKNLRILKSGLHSLNFTRNSGKRFWQAGFGRER